MLVVTWIEKVPQVPVKSLEESWFVGVPRNSSQWLCPQLRLNMLLLLGVVKTLMVPPNNLGPGLSGKPVNETLYRGMVGTLMY